MAQPGEIIGMAGTAFIEGRLEAMSERYLYPFVVAMDEHHHIVRTPEELIEMLGVLRADLMANGMTDARTRIESQMVFNEELAFVSAETIYLDRQGKILTRSKSSYVMRNDTGRWRVLTCAIDQKARHSAGACLLDREAA